MTIYFCLIFASKLSVGEDRDHTLVSALSKDPSLNHFEEMLFGKGPFLRVAKPQSSPNIKIERT